MMFLINISILFVLYVFIVSDGLNCNIFILWEKKCDIFWDVKGFWLCFFKLKIVF